jgi:hypothetical protein
MHGIGKETDMHITIQTIPAQSGGAVLMRQIDAYLRDVLTSEREQVIELDVRHGLVGESEDDDIHCDLRARLSSGARVRVSHAAPTVVRALSGAIGKLRSSMHPSSELSFVP